MRLGPHKGRLVAAVGLVALVSIFTLGWWHVSAHVGTDHAKDCGVCLTVRLVPARVTATGPATVALPVLAALVVLFAAATPRAAIATPQTARGPPRPLA